MPDEVIEFDEEGRLVWATPRYVAYGPGFSGGYDSLELASAVVQANGAGAVYENLGVMPDGATLPRSAASDTMAAAAMEAVQRFMEIGGWAPRWQGAFETLARDVLRAVQKAKARGDLE